MFLVHTVAAHERPAADRRRLLPLVIVGAAGFACALLIALHALPGGVHSAAAAALAGLLALLAIPAWLWPLDHLLTDTHLRVSRGRLAARWVPLDQIRTVAQLPEDSEYLNHGFAALGASRPIVIVNPELGDTHWVVFTPSQEFLRTLLWQIGRSAASLDPLPEGPPLIRAHFSEADDEDAD